MFRIKNFVTSSAQVSGTGRIQDMKKWTVRLLKFVVLPLILILLVSAATALGVRAWYQGTIANQRAITVPNGIEVFEERTIGGNSQWIQVRGHDKSNPILLVLHGGPGAALMPMGHAFQHKWEEHFTVVQWDQRESGKSYTGESGADSMTRDRYVQDTLELVDHLRQRFDQEKIVLLGHSWGSVLGIEAVHRRPEWFHAYVGVGQVVNMQTNERTTYEFTLDQARAHHNAQALAELKAIAPYPGENMQEKLLIQREWLLRFGGGLYGQTSFNSLFKTIAVAPEYSLRDVGRFVQGAYFGVEKLFDELMTVDIEELGHAFDVPILLFSGRHDNQVPSTINEAWFNEISAPHKEYVWFEESAHFSMLEQPSEFAQELIARVLPLTQSSIDESTDEAVSN